MLVWIFTETIKVKTAVAIARKEVTKAIIKQTVFFLEFFTFPISGMIVCVDYSLSIIVIGIKNYLQKKQTIV